MGGAAACAAEARRADGPLRVRAEPVDLYPFDPTRRRVGELTFEAGFALSSDGHALGGLSGLLVDGRDLLAASDGGTLWRATLDLGPDGRMRGVGSWRALPLRWPPRSPHAGSRLDAESLAGAADGSLIVSLEGAQAMLRLDRSGRGPPILETYPEPLRSAPANQGVEALASLPDGRLLAITEGLAAGPGTQRAAVLGRGSPVPLAYRPAPGFKPTAADRLGDVLYILERQASMISGLSARIVRIPLGPDLLVPGAVLEGEELARLGGETICDNMEGLAAAAMSGGRIALYLVSDDNFSALERTLLLQLSLRG